MLKSFLQGVPASHVVLGAVVLWISVVALLNLARGIRRWVPVGLALRPVPVAPGNHWLLGHALQLVGVCAWDRMMSWVSPERPIVRFRILHRSGLVVGDAHAIKRIFQTKQRLYTKDTDFSYAPFLSILGTGLVTANGPHWQEQRLLMAPAFRVDMLDAILPITQRATDRLCAKLEVARREGRPVDLNEELRLLTLQVIGEAILSLPAAECDAVFPALYLPVMEESNRRVLAPWRRLYPVQAAQYSARVRALDTYLAGIIDRRRRLRALEHEEEARLRAKVDGAETETEAKVEPPSTGKGGAGATVAAAATGRGRDDGEHGLDGAGALDAPARQAGEALGRGRAPEASAEAHVRVGAGVGADKPGAAAGADACAVAPPRTRDILDRVLDSLDAKGTRWTSAVTRQLCFELKTFLLAGHETSAAMLAWSLYELSVSPELAAKVIREAEAALPDEPARGSDVKGAERQTRAEEKGAGARGGSLGAEGGAAGAFRAKSPLRADVEGMTYTLACLKESLRKYSVVPVVTRNLEADDELAGEKLPKGSWLIVHLKAVHHQCYADPLVWRPDRYMPGGEYDSFPDDIRTYTFLPFTQGPRNCLGQYFALLEARVILGLLLRRFTFTPLDAERQGVVHPTIIPTGPLHGMDMRIE